MSPSAKVLELEVDEGCTARTAEEEDEGKERCIEEGAEGGGPTVEDDVRARPILRDVYEEEEEAVYRGGNEGERVQPVPSR